MLCIASRAGPSKFGCVRFCHASPVTLCLLLCDLRSFELAGRVKRGRASRAECVWSRLECRELSSSVRSSLASQGKIVLSGALRSERKVKSCFVEPVMKIKYTKSYGYKQLSPKESAVVGRELKKIQSNLSVVTPRVVVEEARDPESPLHQYFEWDDTIAAQKHREWQARSLISSVFIVDADNEDSGPIRAFVSVSPEDDSDDFITDRGYVFTPSIGSRASYQKQVLDYAKNQILNWRRRFGQYKEFLGVCQEIDKLNQ